MNRTACGPLLILVLVALLASQRVSAQASPPATDTSVIETAGSQIAQKMEVTIPLTMNYLIYRPENYQSRDAWPLLLFLHGAGERGDDLEKVKIHGPPKLIAAGKSFPMIVVSPQCPEGAWWEPISLSALLDEIEKTERVDRRRIYVTGLSMGGFGTWGLGSHTPDRFAAIAPVCGGGDTMVLPRRIGKKIPIWVFHGARDTVVPPARAEQLVGAFKGQGIDIRATFYPEAGHDSWTATYDNPELYSWMLSQSLPWDDAPSND